MCISTASVTATKPATAISSTASLDIDYHGVSQLLERIYQDRENSTLSSSSGDSVSSFSSVGSAVRPVGKSYKFVKKPNLFRSLN